jgi:hypothetical protein
VDTIRIDARILYIKLFHALADGHETTSAGGDTMRNVFAVDVEMVDDGNPGEDTCRVGDMGPACEVTVEDVHPKFSGYPSQSERRHCGSNLGFYNFQSLILNIFGDFASFPGHHEHPVTSFDLSLSYGQDHLLRSGKFRCADEMKDGH